MSDLLGNTLSCMKRISIVDDDIATLTSLRRTLEVEGYAVEIYSSPVVALPKLICVPPNLLILNGKMPGMHGIDFFLTFRLYSNTPVIFLSASADEIQAELEAVGTLATAYVSKPISQHALLELLVATLVGETSVTV